MKTLLKRKLSFVFLIVQLLVSVFLCGLAIYVGFIPPKYVIALIVVCVLLLVYQVFSQMTKSSYVMGRILCIFFCAFFLGGSYYMYTTHAAMSDIGGAETKTDIISFYVLKDDPAKSLADAKNYKFGILAQQDRENTDKALVKAKEIVGTDLKVIEYDDTATMVDALYAKEVQSVVFNSAFLSSIKEQYSTFKKDTRELEQTAIETEVVHEVEDTDVTTKPFTVYISGIDVYGKISQTSRSDVNIIATINPVTKKILLVSTPRDYYVPLYGEKGKSVSGGIPDKLTHAGIYGVDCSIGTLEKLYDVKIDYYVRVNFTSLKKIVDLLGGVEVYSDYDFISDWGPNGAGTHYKFKKGYNKVNGKKALAFCRERHHFANGDYQRGRDHQHMIEAILNKAMSPAILQNFPKLLKESKKMFQTSMSTKKITSLCNMQLNDMAKWKISYANAEGSGAKKTTYSIRSTALYVCEPNYASVDKITKKINKVLNETEEDVKKEEEEKAKKSTAEPTLKP
ncbi:MAG: LCP family protein [Eubacterium sp.]|nr:LCP family protein [Eubacterium sp.]